MAIEVSPLLEIAWDILQFVINYGWILFALIFIGVMASTIVEGAKRISRAAAPGLRRLAGRRRRG